MSRSQGRPHYQSSDNTVLDRSSGVICARNIVKFEHNSENGAVADFSFG